jgi:hypothetical protein
MDRDISKLCDTIRHASTRYAVHRRKLVNMSMANGPLEVRKQIDDLVACIDGEMAQIEVALRRYCEACQTGAGELSGCPGTP